MSAEIVNSGRSYITDKLAGNLATTINRFILANVPHSDPNTPVDLDEPMPSSEQVVYDEPITRSAKINVDEVVFSQILLSDVGDFDFNWIGLATDDNTLIAVVYVPLQHKRKYVGNQIGNSITRNVVLKFAQAADALGVTIAPETWQFDMLDVIQAEIQKAIDGHNHDNDYAPKEHNHDGAYYRKQHIDETFATKQEALANSQPNFIKSQDDDIALNKLNVFKVIKPIQLPEASEDCICRVLVLAAVTEENKQ
ncbi:phage tail-collar fiber domain-containing protein, partial [Vibrio rotiferianus]|uniref:phage tail-collar fiber domain-containing protein n=1 Tax=Vibrio rotiferianus TaxID=190895 RepID=UPI00390B04BC